jgi:hypothetical protein
MLLTLMIITSLALFGGACVLIRRSALRQIQEQYHPPPPQRSRTLTRRRLIAAWICFALAIILYVTDSVFLAWWGALMIGVFLRRNRPPRNPPAQTKAIWFMLLIVLIVFVVDWFTRFSDTPAGKIVIVLCVAAGVIQELLSDLRLYRSLPNGPSCHHA